MGRGPAFILVLNVYPALTIAASTVGNINVKLSAAIMLVVSGVLVSVLEGVVPSSIEVPTFVIVITSFMAVMRFLVRKFIPDLCSSLKLCVPLVIMGYVVLKETRDCTSGGPILPSVFSKVNVKLKFAINLATVNVIERLVNTNGVFSVHIVPRSCRPLAVFVLTPKTFFILTNLITLRGGMGGGVTGGKGGIPRAIKYKRNYTDYKGTSSYDKGVFPANRRSTGGRWEEKRGIGRLLLVTINSTFMGGIILDRFLNVYPFLNMSGGIGATTKVNKTIMFIVAVTSFMAKLVCGFVLKGPGVVKKRLSCLGAVMFVLIVTTLMRFMRVFLGGTVPSLCGTLNMCLPLVAAGYTILKMTLAGMRGNCCSSVDTNVKLLANIMGKFTATIKFLMSVILVTKVHRGVRCGSVDRSFRKAPVILIATKLVTVTFFKFSKLV